MEEIYEEIQDYINSLKRHIEAQKDKRKNLKGAKADESLTYSIGMEVGLAALQNLKFKIENIANFKIQIILMSVKKIKLINFQK